MVPDERRIRTDGGEYVVDETVELDGDESFKYHTWDLGVDPDENEKYRLYVISRDGIGVRGHVLPEEEVEHFEKGQEVWSKYRSTYADRITDEFEITVDDEDPYPASADYVLAVATDRAGDRVPTVTVKLERKPVLGDAGE